MEKKMKKLITALLVFAASFVLAADYDIYVDTEINGSQFIMQVEDGSTNTVTFNFLNDGSAITATNYTATMYLDMEDSFGSSMAKSVTGTTSGSSATFAMTNATPYIGMDNWYVRVELGSTYAVDGRLEIDSTPMSVSGEPLAAVRAGAAMPVYQSDTNATTTATQYMPAFVGQLLFGGAGTGTNAVWVSKGTTTNDWVVISQ